MAARAVTIHFKLPVSFDPFHLLAIEVRSACTVLARSDAMLRMAGPAQFRITADKRRITMQDQINSRRRRFLGTTVAGISLLELGLSGLAYGQSADTAGNAKAGGRVASFENIRSINAGTLSVSYAEAGPQNGPVVILLHGWPYDIYSFAEVTPLLTAAGYRVIVPFLRGYGGTRFLSADTPRNGQQAVVAVDIVNLMDALKIDKAVLGGFDWGARTVNIIAALWPQRVKAMVSVSGYLIGSQEANRAPLPPKAELAWWYQFYFATERGRAGYEANRHDFNKLIWHTASPKWNFDDATFERSAESFNNPDHVAVVIHNYRWRLGLAQGEPQYDELEKRLATGPTIAVPTITLEGDANGAAHPEPAAYAKKFTGKYQHRNLTGGIGHNLPQEAPKAFAEAILDVTRL
jgi:pimeloyl-ACP methyl ester carboxylesterase